MISDKFLQNTAKKSPNRILTEALQHVKEFSNALDLGCGAFRDTSLLLENGFSVDAIDNSPNVLSYKPDNEKLSFYPKSFSDFEYPKNKYDIVNAQYSLPFCSPSDFPFVWQNLYSSLKSRAIFAGQFFGPEDGFYPNAEMTFLVKSEVQNLFKEFKILTFVEAKRTSKTATGIEKFWHVFDVIAEKK